MITERTLKTWRRGALKLRAAAEYEDINMKDTMNMQTKSIKELSQRILRMTLELLDLHLMRKK